MPSRARGSSPLRGTMPLIPIAQSRRRQPPAHETRRPLKPEIARLLSSDPDMELTGPPSASEPDESSGHALHPVIPREESSEEITDPAKLAVKVVKLATLVKGLQADTDNLRRDYQALRQGLGATGPTTGSLAQLGEKPFDKPVNKPCGMLEQNIPVISPRPESQRSSTRASSRPSEINTAHESDAENARKESTWSVDRALFLGGDGNSEKLKGKVVFLDKGLVVSVAAAVDGLNFGTFKCAEDACVVYSAASQGYYLLYRSGANAKALLLASGEETETEAKCPAM